MQKYFIVVSLTLLLSGCAATSRQSWVAHQGGLTDGGRVQRVERIGDLLTQNLSGRTTVRVLNNDNISAYSFPDGSIYISRGLVDQVSDEEIAAAVAHELGHLLSDGQLQSVSALRGVDGQLDIEARADAIGCRVLAEHGISKYALVRVLRKVAAATPSQACCNDVCRRICLLGGNSR